MADSTSRLDERAGAVRARRLAAALIVSAVAIAVGSVVASRSSLLHLRHLDVVGATSLTRAEVARLAGLSSATNVLWFDPEAVERRLESDPWIAAATVSRRLPGTIRISVTERSPVAMVRDEAGFTLIGGDGTALETVVADPALPEIVDADDSNAMARAAAARAIAVLDRGRRMTVVRAVVSAGRVEVELEGGVQVEFGEPIGIRAKAQAARRVLRWATERRVSVSSVNVVAADSPTLTLA